MRSCLKERATAREGREVGAAHLELDRACGDACEAQPPADLFGEREKLALGFFSAFEVALEGHFLADGFRLAVRLDAPLVAPEGKFLQGVRCASAKAACELLFVGLLHRADGLDALRGELFLRAPADAPEAAHGKRCDAPNGVFCANLDESVGLFEVARELGEELVRRDADGGDERGFFTDFRLEPLGEDARAGREKPHARDVEEGFVDGKRLDERRVAREDGEDFGGDGAIERVVSLYEDAVGAAAARRRHGHSRVYAASARFVGGGRDDAARRKPADDDGLSSVFGVLTLLDGGEEGVHIDVKNRALHFIRLPVRCAGKGKSERLFGFPDSFYWKRAVISSSDSFERKFSPGWIIWSISAFFFSCSS